MSSRTAVYSKLDGTAYKALESAMMLAKTRGNPYIEVVHWLNQIVLGEKCDFHESFKFFGINEEKLEKDLLKNMDSLPRGASSLADFSSGIDLAVKEAWVTASLNFGEGAIRTGHLLIALKQTVPLARLLDEISAEFVKINAGLLTQQFSAIMKNSAEHSVTLVSHGTTVSNETSEASALALYTHDMCAEEAGEIAGRDAEIRKIIDILLRRRQNNPILTGDAGVGKTAVVEGFAQRLAKGDVPPVLKGTKLLSLDIGLLQAGAGVKGEFEKRLTQVIKEVHESEMPIILFIDEAHTLIGAGGQAGQNDAANLLKPALARGEFRCIAATTYQEYIKYFEKDPALARRFQNIIIEEPDDDKAIGMLRSTVTALEKHHKVLILDEALEAAVKLSRRFIPARQLPDKAVSVLDTACARVALSLNSEPAELEYCRRRIDAIKLEQSILKREDDQGIEHSEKEEKLKKELDEEEAQEKELAGRYEKEKTLVDEIINLRSGDKPDIGTLMEKRRELLDLQKDRPMIMPQVDREAVAEVIAEWTGIPVGRMANDEIKSVLQLGTQLKKRVIGQDHSLDLISKRVTTARASLADAGKPLAVLMLAGPSGVGKTETALALAEQMYGSEEQMITINMSEYQEAYTVSTLKGAPPGYVGYGEGGVLTEAVRRKPYSVILLDEMEKAHADVHEIFFQVFDKGRMEDGSGRLINFRNCIIIMTTNVGTEIIEDACRDENNLPDPMELEKAIRPALIHSFPAALLGRIQVVPYYPLGQKALYSIIEAKLIKIRKRLDENYHASFKYDDSVKDEIIRRCDNASSGARLIDAVINNTLLPEISTKLLENMLDKKTVKAVMVKAEGGAFIWDLD